ncbi:hypothetical protein [Kitasatospora cineracea]|uniref:hypothetical protein n=1 Tax=Kitasatospora cineracea TaxID=88074 RepID=UPI0037A5D4AE
MADRILLTDPRVARLAVERQQMAHEGTCLPTWDELSAAEQEGSLLDARNYLAAAIRAGLAPENSRPVSAPEQPAAPVQPPADLRQRLAEAIRAAAYDCDGHCGLDEAECLDRHPITVAVEHHGVATDVYGPVTALAEVAAAEVEPELAKRQARGDIWKAKAAELEQDRDRLDTGLAALREQLAQAREQFAAVAAQRDRLRTRMNNLADRWDTALAVDKPYARDLRAEISVDPFTAPSAPSA